MISNKPTRYYLFYTQRSKVKVCNDSYLCVDYKTSIICTFKVLDLDNNIIYYMHIK